MEKMMGKNEVYQALITLFAPVHVQGWLSRFPDDHEFDEETMTGEFIDYINGLGEIHEREY